MSRTRTLLLFVVVVGAGFLALVLLKAKPEDRLAVLQARLAEQERLSWEAVESYKPLFPGRIDDMTFPAHKALIEMPGVRGVGRSETGVSIGRIIHIRDWHRVPREDFAADTGLKEGTEEFETAYKAHLLEVAIVQTEQEALLRILIRHHGLKEAFVEGVAHQDADELRKILDGHRETFGQLLKQKAEAAFLKGEKGETVRAEVDKLIKEYRQEFFVGVSPLWTLYASGELENVIPVEDSAALAAEKPDGEPSNLKRDPAKRKARNDAQVKRMVANGRFALIVLGGSHNLIQRWNAFADSREMITVTTKRYAEVSGEKE